MSISSLKNDCDHQIECGGPVDFMRGASQWVAI
jgi:hypothetical protein